MESNIREILKPWIDAKQKAIEAEADENEKTRWQHLIPGLKKHQRQRFIDGEWSTKKYAIRELESAAIACQRHKLPFKVTSEGVFLTEPLEKYQSLHAEAVKNEGISSAQEAHLYKVIEALNNISKAIPSNESEMVLDVTISLRGFHGDVYKNSETKELLKEKRKALDEARREYRIALAFAYLLRNGYIKEG